MKTIRQLLILIAVSTFGICVSANDDVSSFDTVLIPLPHKEEPGIHERPRMPSSQRIYYGYDCVNNCSVFILPAYVDYIDVTIENVSTHAIYFGHVDSSDPSMYQPLDPGSYIITCETMQGDIYEGEVFI